MNTYVKAGGLSIASDLHTFVSEKFVELIGLSSEEIWARFAKIAEELMPENARLLAKRDQLQAAIDDWHKTNRDIDTALDLAAYKSFLTEIGYLEEEGDDFTIGTENVDPEIARLAGPQLVVPVTNARFALNAANARWGSLYDAFYGTDVIPLTTELNNTGPYNPKRGALVIARAMEFLDQAMPIADGRHADVVRYMLEQPEGARQLTLKAQLDNGNVSPLANPEQFLGFLGSEDQPSSLLLVNNGLHIELQIDPTPVIGKTSKSGVKDIVLEAALTVIQDLEDSVSTVDAADKVAAYRNWAGLINGSLQETFTKGGREISRKLNQDRSYVSPEGSDLNLPGRSLQLVRNVGHLTTTDCVLDAQGNEVPEGFVDAFITTLCALPGILGKTRFKNSQTASVYIVKPKMHGSEEVQLTDRLFARVEQALNLPKNTIKIGVMDEERRTSVNLKECIRAVKDRIVFINTGFLDRTGDEIHTSMEAGAVLPKEQIKAETWLQAYEKRNVAIGLSCGFRGKAQIGKGMWPKPDEMAQMVAEKHTHLAAGANCAWVPSPTAAVLHALHYHQIRVDVVQESLLGTPIPNVDLILHPPLLKGQNLSADEIQQELDQNIQGILGYVVRWIDQGIGCSKVPDINNVGLMEDRATLRISSQHVANWLQHGICSEAQVQKTFETMAEIVDQQNTDDAVYRPMAASLSDNIAFNAACDLVFKGRAQPNGYTELILTEARRAAKAI